MLVEPVHDKRMSWNWEYTCHWRSVLLQCSWCLDVAGNDGQDRDSGRQGRGVEEWHDWLANATELEVLIKSKSSYGPDMIMWQGLDRDDPVQTCAW